jgi:hypothetical protein
MVDQDFDMTERTQVMTLLQNVIAEPQQPERKLVAEALMQLVEAIPAIQPPEPNIVQRTITGLKALESRYASRTILRSFLFVAFTLSSLGGLAVILLMVPAAADPLQREEFIGALVAESFLGSVMSLQWMLIQIILTGIMGLLYLLAALLLVRWESTGVRIGRFTLLLELTVVNILAFYFSQFAMIFSTLLALGILLAVERYRSRFLRRTGG